MATEGTADDVSNAVIAKVRQTAKEENADVEDDKEAEASVIAVEISATLRPKLWGHILKKTTKRQFIFDSDEHECGCVPDGSLLYDAIRHSGLSDVIQSHIGRKSIRF